MLYHSRQANGIHVRSREIVSGTELVAFELMKCVASLNRDSVVITPHIAFNSREAVQRILEATGENIRAFSGGQLRDLVGNSHLRSAPFTPGVANLDKLPAEASFDAEMAARHLLVQR